MADFAIRTDVETVYGGALPGTNARTEYLVRTANARLAILLPALEAAVADDDDLADIAKDIVVQAVIRRLPLVNGEPSVQSQTQTAGPWTTTVRYTEDRSETFSDDDLALLREVLNRTTENVATSAGTIRLGRPDWTLG